MKNHDVYLEKNHKKMNPSLLLVFSLFLFVLIIGLINLAWRIFHLPCPSWLGWMVEMDNPFTRMNQAKEIIRLLKVEPGMQVLDAGCGPGRLTIPLAKAVAPTGTVIALDLQEEMLKKVSKKAAVAGIQNIHLIRGKLGEGVLPKSIFDRALLVTVLGEIPDQEAALKELLEGLKSGGILSISEVIFDPHFQTSEKVTSLAISVGFQQIHLFGNRLAYTLHFQKP